MASIQTNSNDLVYVLGMVLVGRYAAVFADARDRFDAHQVRILIILVVPHILSAVVIRVPKAGLGVLVALLIGCVTAVATLTYLYGLPLTASQFHA